MRAGISLLAMGYEYSNLGHLARLIFPEAYAKNGLQDLESMNMPADWMELRGYYPLEVSGNVTDVVQENHERFLKGDAAFEGLINNQKTEGVGLAELPHKNLLSLYSNMFADIEGHGLKAGFYVPPLPGRTAENMALVDALKGNNSEVLFFDYNDPDRYGQYWDKAVWYDDAHLNDNASAMLSEDMASQICKVSKAWGAR
jgi:hypothetical protein